MAPSTKTVTGARARIMVDGAVVGFATAVSYTVTYNYQRQDCIDSLETVELVPVGMSVSGRIGTIKIAGRTAKSMGLIPRAGKDADEHLQNVLLQKDATFAVYDKGTSKTLATVTGVRFTGHGLNINAGGIVGEDIPFEAIRETDESEAAI